MGLTVPNAVLSWYFHTDEWMFVRKQLTIQGILKLKFKNDRKDVGSYQHRLAWTSSIFRRENRCSKWADKRRALVVANRALTGVVRGVFTQLILHASVYACFMGPYTFSGALRSRPLPLVNPYFLLYSNIVCPQLCIHNIRSFHVSNLLAHPLNVQSSFQPNSCEPSLTPLRLVSSTIDCSSHHFLYSHSFCGFYHRLLSHLQWLRQKFRRLPNRRHISTNWRTGQRVFSKTKIRRQLVTFEFIATLPNHGLHWFLLPFDPLTQLATPPPKLLNSTVLADLIGNTTLRFGNERRRHLSLSSPTYQHTDYDDQTPHTIGKKTTYGSRSPQVSPWSYHLYQCKSKARSLPSMGRCTQHWPSTQPKP